MVYVLTACEQDQDGTEFLPDPVRKLSANLYDVYHCCVYSEKIPDDGQRNCPKHVEFYSINKFEKLVHLFGFIIRTQDEPVVDYVRNVFGQNESK